MNAPGHFRFGDLLQGQTVIYPKLRDAAGKLTTVGAVYVENADTAWRRPIGCIAEI
ncbi:hypothetical protein K1T73_09290 [Roseovarius sp. SCSIO 43702]|uniref:hypothetical protein n=1 Tax=Roseovarius sp. SCSIO 43702 TaxID=2823043 RepID=UPI001C7397B9|nr:hypothetical protein [Roseovarius sp. SCSIO 43702]QYX55312.1 hypothetical protein K1T73_09290 [Roseovarius sp. SCSIO 43702]